MKPFLKNQAAARRKLRLPAASLALLLLLLLFASAAMRGGASPVPDRYTRLGQQLICVCGCRQGLLVCNDIHCSYRHKMRQELRRRIALGGSDTAIIQAFVQEYGTAVLAVPAHHGFDRLAWILPWLAAGAGVLLLLLTIHFWSRRRLPAPAAPSSAALDQVRRELAESGLPEDEPR